MKHKHSFDFSDNLKDLKFFDETNKKVIGKLKDESEGKIIDKFVGSKSKVKNIDGKESNTAKEVNVTNEFNEFKDTLFNMKIIRHKMRREYKNGNIRNQQNIIICF